MTEAGMWQLGSRRDTRSGMSMAATAQARSRRTGPVGHLRDHGLAGSTRAGAATWCVMIDDATEAGVGVVLWRATLPRSTWRHVLWEATPKRTGRSGGCLHADRDSMSTQSHGGKGKAHPGSASRRPPDRHCSRSLVERWESAPFWRTQRRPLWVAWNSRFPHGAGPAGEATAAGQSLHTGSGQHVSGKGILAGKWNERYARPVKDFPDQHRLERGAGCLLPFCAMPRIESSPTITHFLSPGGGIRIHA